MMQLQNVNIKNDSFGGVANGFIVLPPNLSRQTCRDLVPGLNQV